MKSWAEPTPEDLARIDALAARPENRAYFFDRLENPTWLKPLADRGYFSDPPPSVPADEPGYLRFPPWPEGRYLARVASDAAADAARILLASAVSDNPTVTRLQFESAAQLPDAQLRSVGAIAAQWAGASFPEYFEEEATKLTLRLLGADMLDHAFHVLETLLAVRVERRPPIELDDADASYEPPPHVTGRFSDWHYGRVLESVAVPVVSTAGTRGLDLFRGLLEEAVRGGASSDPEGDDYSYLWRPAVENHSQNTDRDVRSLLVSAVRDAALTCVANNDDELHAVVAGLERGSVVFQRIALHVLAHTDGGLDLVMDRVADRRLFDQYQVGHEYAELLRSRFGELPPEAQERWLAWVDAGPDTEHYRNRRSQRDDSAPSDELVAQYVASWQRDRLSYVAQYLLEPRRAQFEQLVREYGQANHPDFPTWLESGWSGPESPTTETDLMEWPLQQILTHLAKWAPESDSGWHFGPSIEGLGRTVTAVVAKRASEFAHVAAAIAQLDPTYVRAVFSGLEAARKDGVQFDWAGPVELAAAVVAHPFEQDEEVGDRDRDPGWRWCRREIGSLLRVGMSDKPGAIPFELRDQVWGVIERLTHDPNPSREHEQRYGGDNMDPFTLSINVNRGTAMHAVIEYALWCRRSLEVVGVDVGPGFGLMPEVAELLETRLDIRLEPSLAVRSVFGRWLPWLLLLDEGWTETHLASIFPEDPDAAVYATVAWDTYVMWCPAYDSALRALHKQYETAVERVPSGDSETRIERDSVDLKLGQHLMVFAWRGVVDDELLGAFYERAPDRLIGRVLEFVGHALRDTDGALPAEFAARLQALWDDRVSGLLDEPDAHRFELRAFGAWFVSAKFDPEWALSRLEKAVVAAGAPALDFLVVENLVEVATEQPARAVSILWNMLRQPENEWDYVGWRESALAIVQRTRQAGFDSDDLHNVIDWYVRHGDQEFRTTESFTQT